MYNLLRDVVANLLRQAHMGVTVEAGYGLTHDNSRSRPADVLVTRWEKGLPAALDITVTSPLNPAILDESCSTNMLLTTLSSSSWGGPVFHWL